VDDRKRDEKLNTARLTWERDVTRVVEVRELCMQDGKFLRYRIAVPIAYKTRKMRTMSFPVLL
jgi:hypothetical protein